MLFNPDNNIMRLCAEGMALEGAGKKEEALQLFLQAWEEAASHPEKFTAAHYIARHQPTVTDKLRWDETALQHALLVDGDEAKATYPSLYLNIAKCHEDLGAFEEAEKHYQLAQSYTHLLPEDGYGNMIKNGIRNGLERVNKRKNENE